MKSGIRHHNPAAGHYVFLALCTPRFEVADYEDMEARNTLTS